MAYSVDENLFWELVELDDAILVLDNDMCYVQANFNEDTGDYETSESFDFSHRDIIYLLAEKSNIEVESV